MNLVPYLPTFLAQYLCEHDYQFQQNVYGDDILRLNCRSIYVCKLCGKKDKRNTLYTLPNIPQFKIDSIIYVNW